jgi:iron complex outermembrane receptor protein
VEVVAPRPSYAGRVQVTGSRQEEPVSDVPQSMTVLDRRLLDDVGARRADDAMLLVPGVQLFSGYGGTWDDYTIRGFHVWSVQTYRNGFMGGYSGPNATDAVNVERVEVLRGPASALYGPGLPGGSINYVTKQPLRHPRVTLGVVAGSFDTFRTELDATGPVSHDVRYRLTASGDTSSGYRDYNVFRRWLANPVVAIDLGPKTTLLVEAQGYQEMYRADPDGVPVVGGDPFAFPVSRSFIEPALKPALVEGALGRVELTHQLGQKWTVRLAFEDKLGHYEEETILTGPIAADGRTIPRGVFNWSQGSESSALQAVVHGEFPTGPLTHSVFAGVDAGREVVSYRAAGSDPAYPFNIDAFAPQYGSRIPPAPLPTGSPNQWSYGVAGVYASDMITVLPFLRVLVGARADSYSQKDFNPPVVDGVSELTASPRAAVLVNPLPGLSLYANVNQGFWPSLGVTADGHVLHPEHSLTYEAGLRKEIDGDRLTVDADVFHLVNRDIAVIDPTNPNFQVNRGEATSQGLELSVTAAPYRWLRLIASYAYVDASVTSDPDPTNVGKPLPFAAKHSGAAWVQTSFLDARARGPSLGVGGVATSERSLLDHTTVPGYGRVDAVAGYRFGRELGARLRVQNALDQRYVRGGNDTNGILPGAPRAFFVELNASLW